MADWGATVQHSMYGFGRGFLEMGPAIKGVVVTVVLVVRQ